ncbi:hypothetical protein ETD86_51705 [Nonomuraea turkmeniaca]|uniref:Uncharacterized protein n=1 Tax=Nonomuraea turkmeniaca TaxID=103838 RepID=A0A5S4EVN6_9ACTN|nr:hypothetical protein ETD86_51705 [Nonomuraea turkmeniaca]
MDRLTSRQGQAGRSAWGSTASTPTSDSSTLVMFDVRADGRNELVALGDGYHESTDRIRLLSSGATFV